MELTIEKGDVQSSWETEAIKFGIDTDTPFIFELLSKKLYPHPIKAISREIAANARDAHREVGKPDIPIEITVPGDEVVFRDYGPGISPDRIRNIFCYFGRSTKRDNNLQTGGFGLGAKSVFAYSDSFIVETVHEGTKYVYQAGKNADQMLEMNLLAESATDEPSGTMIKIPVSYYDRNEFRQEIAKATMFWSVRPVYRGQMLELAPTPLMETEDFNTYAINANLYYGTFLVDEFLYEDAEREVQGLQSNYGVKIVLKFKTGELDLTPNRDQILYSQKTKLAIAAKLQKFKDTFIAQIQNKIDQAADFVEVLDILRVNYPRNESSVSWTYNSATFSYPLKENSLIRLTKDNSRRTYTYSTNRLDCNNYKLSYLCLDKQVDLISPYDKRRIKYIMEQENAEVCYLVPQGIWPMYPQNLSEVKLPKNAARTPKQTKVKTELRVRSLSRDKLITHSLLDDTTLYCYDSELHVYQYARQKYVRKLSGSYTIVSVDVKHDALVKTSKWQHIDDWLQKNLFSVVTVDQAKAYAKYAALQKEYYSLSALFDKSINSPINPLTHLNLNDLQIKLLDTLYDESVDIQNESLYNKYPLLRHIRTSWSWDDDVLKEVRHYIKLVNGENKDDEQG